MTDVKEHSSHNAVTAIEIAGQTKAITLRSVALGLGGTIFICALTPYNDYVLNNTFLVGNNLPLGVTLLLFLFVVAINSPLSRFAPRLAFSSGELTVTMSMMLVGCALPSSGLMRYLPPSLVMPMVEARQNHEYLVLLESIGIPKWLLPDMAGDGPRQWMNDPTIFGYFQRWNVYGPNGAPVTPPYIAWVRPALVWLIFLASLWIALLCIVNLVLRQWVENERLSFPLAEVQLALVEAPQRGRWFNHALGRKSFWFACGAVLAVRVWNGSGKLFATGLPAVPMSYNIRGLLANPPWSYVADYVAIANIYFIVVGITYFLTNKVALSLWSFVLLAQVYRIMRGTTGLDVINPGEWDQHFGALIAFAAMIFWIGRDHFKTILRQALRGHRAGEPSGPFLSYPIAFWLLIACFVLMVAWLTVAGAQVWAATVVVLILLMLFFVFTRIIAETGLVYGQLLVPLYRPWQLAAMFGWGKVVSLKTFYLTSLLQVNFYDFRETLPVYASHGLRVAASTIMPGIEGQQRVRSTAGRTFMILLLFSVLIAYAVSFASTLWTEYAYSVTRDAKMQSPINDWGCSGAPMVYMQWPMQQYDAGKYQTTYRPLLDVAGGALLTTILIALHLRCASWPLHPVGFLMMPTTPIQLLWFSIFLGWLGKLIVVRLGGSKLYSDAKPIFLGLIFGDVLAAGVWLLVAIAMNAAGLPYEAVTVMPT